MFFRYHIRPRSTEGAVCADISDVELTFENYADFLPAMPLMDFSLGRTCATYSGTQRLRSRRTSESSGIRS